MNGFISRKPYGNVNTDLFATPKQSNSFRNELKQALNDRNALTVKSRQKLCDMLDDPLPTTPNANAESQKKLQFRRQAIEEILTSERSYIGQLEKLMTYFVIPLKQRQIINAAQFNALFGQLEMIYNLNKELIAELETDLDNVAKAFLRMAPFFKLYSVYAFDYNKAQLILQELTEKNSTFRKFLEDTEFCPEVQTKMIALMIAPIQRIPRYRLLLQQVFLYSSPGDSDFRILQESIKEVENTVMHMNTVIEDQEITQILIDLQNSFLNQRPSIVKPGRKIIKQGLLQKMSSSGMKLKRHCVLLSDIFLYCKVLKESTKTSIIANSLECCCIFPLKKCRVVELFPGNFKITCQGDGIILCCDDLQSAQNWISIIRETIDLHIQTRKTIRKDSSKRKPMRKKQLKYFDADQLIVSPTKRKSDYETVFRFTSDSDAEEQNEQCKSAETFCSKTFNQAMNIFKRKRKIANENSLTIPSRIIADNSFEKNLEDDDPTYGFATFAQKSNIRFELKPINSPTIKDVLYPLRTNSAESTVIGQSPSSEHSKNKNNSYNVSPAVSSTSLNSNVEAICRKKKRVTFNDLSNEQMEYGNSLQPTNNQEIYQRFSNVPQRGQQQLSLRQRITQFFANLF